MLWRRDQRHVGETLKDQELEQASHAATPFDVDKKNENNAGSDGSKEENQCEQGQRQTKHDEDAGDGDDKNSVQMTNDERDVMNDSQALTGGDITSFTEHSWHASVTCHKIHQISSLRQCKYAVRWQNRQRLTWNESRGLEGISW